MSKSPGIPGPQIRPSRPTGTANTPAGARGLRRALLMAIALAGPVVFAVAFPMVGSAQTTAPCSTVASTNNDPQVYGCWSAPINLGTVGINSILMPDGNVLLYGLPELSEYQATGAQGSDAQVLNPATGQLTDVSLQSQLNLLCTGVSVLPSGNVLATGGLLYNSTDPYVEGTTGINNITEFNQATQTWSSVGTLSYPRWYPSNLELGSGKILVFGGQQSTGVYDNNVDLFDPTTGSTTLMPGTAYFGNYPHVYLMTNGMVVKVAPAQATRIYNPNTGALGDTVATMNFGNREYGATAMLPGLNEILAAGGSDVGTKNPTATAEILNLTTMKWSYTGSLNYPRLNENLVDLPDGTVLSVGGGGGGGLYANPVTSAELYNPNTGTWSLMASQTVQRTYHSTAILLPDGRVLSAGSDHGSLENTYEIYSPPYLFAGSRPTIASSPATVGYGQTFGVTTPDASSIARVELISPGAATHDFNMGQRFVNLSYSVAGGQLTVTGPATSDVAPPGWYMLFIVNSSGVPSQAAWVNVEPAGGGPGQATQFAVTMPSGVAQGAPVAVTVSALDAQGNVASGYQGTVRLSSSDSSAALPPWYTFTAADAGTHTFAVTLNTTGTQSVTAMDTVTPTITGTGSTDVLGASRLAVSAPGTMTPGVTAPVTVTALDSAGAVVPDYAGTVSLTSGDSAASLPPPYQFTAADAGSHTFSVVLNTVGSQTITATDQGTPPLTGTTTTTVVGGATQLRLTVPVKAGQGVAAPVTVAALDSGGSVVPSYTGTVHFTSSDPGATLPSDYTFTAADQGTHTFDVTFAQLGTVTLTVTDVASPTLTATASSFVSGPATHFALYPPKSVVAGKPFGLTVVALDAHNNVAVGYTGTVSFSSSDSLAILPADVTFSSQDQGRVSVRMEFGTAGTQTVTAQDTVTPSTAGTVSVSVGT